MDNEFRLEIDIAPIQVPCRIYGQGYILERASAAAAAQWQAKLLESTKLGEDGKIKEIGAGVTELDFVLLTHCLRHATLDEQGKVKEALAFVTEDEAKALPNAAVAPLAARAKKISAMEPVASRQKLLEARIDIDRKLAELDAEAKGEDPLADSPVSTTAGSA